VLNRILRAADPADESSGTADFRRIVELFTSKGCSGCPPADALLQQLYLKQTDSGQLIVGRARRWATHHLILFAQESHQGAIVGAATTPI